MFSICSLSSGSSGNSFLIRVDKTALLIDAGIKAESLLRKLQYLHVKGESLKAVLLTHEHSDHCTGLRKLWQKLDFVLIANFPTLQKAMPQVPKARFRVLPTGSSFSVGKLKIKSFPVPHDAAEPVGYSFYYQGKKVCMAIDQGHVTVRVKKEMSDAHLSIIECNHDPQLLAKSPYRRFLKERIAGKSGHLSNEQAFKLIHDHPNRKNTLFWLAHLSQVNNSPELAAITMNVNLKLNNIKDAKFKILPRHRTSEHWSILEDKQQLLF